MVARQLQILTKLVIMQNEKDQTPQPAEQNAIKDHDAWTTGDEPMTGAQRSYLHTLGTEAGEKVDDQLTKSEASKKIDELQHKTGRGLPKSHNYSE
jgi:hypothetical protein